MTVSYTHLDVYKRQVGSYFFLQSFVGDEVNGVDMSAVKDMLNGWVILQGLFSSLLMLVCGIFGLNGKSFKVCLIGMIIYLVIVVIAFIQSIMLVGFQVFSIIDFILPILYLWGLYQSKE